MSIEADGPALASLTRLEQLVKEVVNETMNFNTQLGIALQRDLLRPEGADLVKVDYRAGQVALQLLTATAIMNIQPWAEPRMTDRLFTLVTGAVEGRGYETSRGLAALIVERLDDLQAIANGVDGPIQWTGIRFGETEEA